MSYIKFPYYSADIHDSRPLGYVTLFQMLTAIRRPKPETIETFNKIHKADSEGDMETKAKLKESLFSFTPCVMIHGRRRYADIEYFTGYMVLDFDKLDPNYCTAFKKFLFDEYPFIIATWLSASRRGVRAVLNITTPSTVDEFQALFEGLAIMEMRKYNGFDRAPKNPVLPLFQSYDPDLLYRPTPDLWDTSYTPHAMTRPLPSKTHYNPDFVLKYATNAMNKITDNGHPQVRTIAYTIGGYVATGQIFFDEALSLMESLIDSNRYLTSFGERKTRAYKRTAREMLTKGQNSPLYL